MPECGLPLKEGTVGFISLGDAADRLGISLSYFRDLIDRVDRKETILDQTDGADFWSSATGLIHNRDLRVYENILRQRRFVGFRERYADVISNEAVLTIRPGWESLLERVCERVRWMPGEWNVRLAKARELNGFMVLRFDFERDWMNAARELERLREEIRLSSLAVCEECGSWGRFRYSDRSLTLCDRHARLAEPLRPGDGLMSDPFSNGAALKDLSSERK